MSGKFGGITFVVILLLSGAVLYGISDPVLGETSEYRIVNKGQKEVGKELRLTLYVETRSGKQEESFEVRKEAYDSCQIDSLLHIKVRRVALLNAELYEYTLAHEGAVTYQWQTGKPQFFASLAVAAVGAAIAVTVLFAIIGSALRLKAPVDQ